MSVRCLDSSFLIDFAGGHAAATRKAQGLVAVGERIAIPAPVLAEVLVRAMLRGGTYQRRMTELLANLEVLPTDSTVATDAGMLGAELARRGTAAGTVDLLIAATARLNNAILVTRDRAFAGMPGLAVEAY
jgi:tRNA(fMet)-specific endonuclease VapC